MTPDAPWECTYCEEKQQNPFIERNPFESIKKEDITNAEQAKSTEQVKVFLSSSKVIYSAQLCITINIIQVVQRHSQKNLSKILSQAKKISRSLSIFGKLVDALCQHFIGSFAALFIH